LLEEEMRRILAFLTWRSNWWMEKVNRRGLPDGPQREGETAYALRQAAIQATLAAEFVKQWEGLDDLIRRGREGTVVEEVDESDEEGEGRGGHGSGEEEEPIQTLPQRRVKSTHVDEILSM
jgi:hypothetical protein